MRTVHRPGWILRGPAAARFLTKLAASKKQQKGTSRSGKPLGWKVLPNAEQDQREQGKDVAREERDLQVRFQSFK